MSPEGFEIEGYVIVSREGMLADGARHMPDSLKISGDQSFFSDALDSVDLIVHGRHSFEGHANSPRRRRIVLTRGIDAIGPSPDDPRTTLWNPLGARFVTACNMAGITRGRIAVIGGPDVFSMFLNDYSAFYLSQAPDVSIPNGTLAIADEGGRHPAEVLKANGLVLVGERGLSNTPRASVSIFQRRN